MNASQRTALLKAWAHEEGFDLAGACELTEMRGADSYRAWVERGDAAGMGYMARRLEERGDPRLLVPGARSALCVAWKYWPVEGEERRGDFWEGVARYARGRDYHDTMTKRLRRLNDRIEAGFPGARGRWYVDTGPILERELAERSGIGAVGKNTNLLSQEAGSWFLLGEILLNLDLVPDTGVSDLCGTCTACLDACPTGALPEPYRLDSNRCISYWTIEHRGSVPREMRGELGQWVFGCDVCQEVCPVNDAPAPTNDDALRPTDLRREVSLTSLLTMERENYVETFRKSPMKRAKLGGLKRNAAIAMGNRGDESYLPALEKALGDEEEVVRSHAAWAIGEIGGSMAEELLERGLVVEESPEVRAELKVALAEACDKRVRGLDSG